MRILHSIPSVDLSSGGPIQGVLARVPLLKELGHEIEIVSLDSPDQQWVKDCPVPVHALGDGKGGYGFSAKLAPWVRDNAGRFDRVVINGIWQYHAIGTEEGLRGSKVPYFVFTHGMLDPWFRKRYPLKHVKKQVFWLAKQHRVLAGARAVLFTCEEERVLARNAFWPYRIRERVVNYGTEKPGKPHELYQAAFRETFPQLGDKEFVLYLSRIHEKKGVDLLVEAYREIAQKVGFDLVVAGPDPTGFGKKLADQCAAWGISDRVHWIGMVKGDAKYGAFIASQASILPSHQENFGITVAESLAVGRPVLISDKVNIWREIQEDGAGLVAPDTLEGTRELFAKWIATSEADRRTMSENAERCFDSRFEIHKSVESYLEALA